MGLTEGHSLVWAFTVVALMGGIGGIAPYPLALYYRLRRGEEVKYSEWAAHGSGIASWTTGIFLLVDWIVGRITS